MQSNEIRCMACFELPQSWPAEAKELVCDIYELIMVGPSLSDEEEYGKWQQLKKYYGIRVSRREREMMMSACDTKGLTIEIRKGDEDNPLPKEEWTYFLHEYERFDPDLASWILDIVTYRYEIPYDQRIEVSYCFYKEKPSLDFMSGTVVSYFEPLICYEADSIEEEDLAKPSYIERERVFYETQIDDLILSDADKGILHGILEWMMKSMLEAGEIFSETGREPWRIYTVEQVYKHLLDAVHNLEKLKKRK